MVFSVAIRNDLTPKWGKYS